MQVKKGWESLFYNKDFWATSDLRFFTGCEFDSDL